MSLLYPDIQSEKDEKGRVQYTYAAGAARKRLHQGVVVNNCTQFLARNVMTESMLRVDRRYPVRFTVHDEFGIVVPDAEVSEAVKWVKSEMIQVPKWLPGIPLNAGVGAARRYGAAKG